MDIATAEEIKTREIPIESDHLLKAGMEEYERGQRLRQRVITADNYICLERARIVTRCNRETEGDNILLQRAKMFDEIMRGISVYILEDELVVGHQAGKQRSAPIFPEIAVEWIEKEIDTFETSFSGT
jgi:formate C-acetyltransferase